MLHLYWFLNNHSALAQQLSLSEKGQEPLIASQMHWRSETLLHSPTLLRLRQQLPFLSP
jgi:hypothetical protein